MADIGKWDRRIKVGSIVFNNYNNTYCEVVEIQRRFVTESDLRYSCYKNIGDEYNPIVFVKVIVSKSGEVIKSRTVKNYDAKFFNVITEKLLKDEMDFELDLINKKFNALFQALKKG
jgi:hypothetical protein